MEFQIEQPDFLSVLEDGEYEWDDKSVKYFRIWNKRKETAEMAYETCSSEEDSNIAKEILELWLMLSNPPKGVKVKGMQSDDDDEESEL